MLVANGVGPILLIAFTNHALDHMLCSVLDAGITTDIVRLGSNKSADERIGQYSIETREMVAGQSRLDHTYNSKYREFKTVGTEISHLIEAMQKIDLESDSSEIIKYLQSFHPEHHVSMSDPPAWIGVAKSLSENDSESEGKWQKQGRKGKVITEDTSAYAFWKNCGDLDFLETITSPVAPLAPQFSHSLVEPASSEPGPSAHPNRFEALQTEAAADDEDELSSEKDDDETNEESSEIPPEKKLWMNAPFLDTPDTNSGPEAEKAKTPASHPAPPSFSPPVAEEQPPYSAYVNDAVGFFDALGEDYVPTVPFGRRTVEALLDEGEVWNMSQHERQKLHKFWIEEARTQMQQNQQDEFDRLRKKHAEKVQEYNEIKEEVSGERLGGFLVSGTFYLCRFDAIC